MTGNISVGRIRTISLREVWEREDNDFTPWLAKNIDYLSEELGISLNVLKEEQNVGSFRIDIWAEDNNGNYVVIENQLERTDHKHLGQLITYMVGIGATTGIWICDRAVDEHRKAVQILNEEMNHDFYLVEVKAIVIEKDGKQSSPAPSFTVIERPSETSKIIGITRRQHNEEMDLRTSFWAQLLEKDGQRSRILSSISLRNDYWLAVASGKPAITFNYYLVNTNAYVSLEFWSTVKDPEITNKKRFDFLYENKEAIEKEIGAEFDWKFDERTKSQKIWY